LALCHRPTPVRDFWYEFLDFGWGTRTSESGTQEAMLVGRYPVFSDIVPTNKKVICQCDVASDVGKQILVLGYDDNGNWIRTTQGGVILDGELITLAQTPGTTSTNFFSVITDIQIPEDMDGQWWLYEYDTILTTSRMIGRYQFMETRPSYARYLFPSIGTNSTLVECLVKLDFIPVEQDTDYCLIGNIPALKKMCMAVKAEEENRFQDAVALEAMAVTLLDQELSHYLGEGRTIGVNVINSGIGQAVETFI